MIDRYGICTVGEMYKEDRGEWVLYEDAAARIAGLEAEVRFLCSLCNPHGGESTGYKPVKFLGFPINEITRIIATERKRLNDEK